VSGENWQSRYVVWTEPIFAEASGELGEAVTLSGRTGQWKNTRLATSCAYHSFQDYGGFLFRGRGKSHPKARADPSAVPAEYERGGAGVKGGLVKTCAVPLRVATRLGLPLTLKQGNHLASSSSRGYRGLRFLSRAGDISGGGKQTSAVWSERPFHIGDARWMGLALRGARGFSGF